MLNSLGLRWEKFSNDVLKTLTAVVAHAFNLRPIISLDALHPRVVFMVIPIQQKLRRRPPSRSVGITWEPKEGTMNNVRLMGKSKISVAGVPES
jgi:hypothetical protein